MSTTGATNAPGRGGRMGTFAGHVSPPAHVVTFFEDDQELLGIVTDFVRTGLEAGDSVVVLVTAEHLRKLPAEFAHLQIDVESARRAGRYLEIDTNDAYESLLSQGWPEQHCFDTAMAELLRRSRMPGRVVRCVGEIVGVMWARGEHVATIRLEHMLMALSDLERIVILCLYPRNAFERNMVFGLEEVHGAHSIVGR